MLLSQKTQYALRAVYELGLRYGEGPVKISAIAAAQDIPRKFLELILQELKQGGFAVSRRGKAGGYMLRCSPADVTVGQILRFMEGPFGPVTCLAVDDMESCDLRGRCVFLPMWARAERAVSEIYDQTSLQDLVSEERERNGLYVPRYEI